MLSLNEVQIQLYLHKRESELGSFILRIRRANIENKHACEKYKLNTIGKFVNQPDIDLFNVFFLNERELVKDMDVPALRAHRELLAKIAFEARAKLTAADETIREKTNRSKGFATSLQTDEQTSDAINAINARKGKTKLSREDRLRAGMAKLGISSDFMNEAIKKGKVISGQLFISNEMKKLTAVELKSGETYNCIECNHAFDDKCAGTVICPQCKTSVIVNRKVPFSNPFRK